MNAGASEYTTPPSHQLLRGFIALPVIVSQMRFNSNATSLRKLFIDIGCLLIEYCYRMLHTRLQLTERQTSLTQARSFHGSRMITLLNLDNSPMLFNSSRISVRRNEGQLTGQRSDGMRVKGDQRHLIGERTNGMRVS